MKAPRIFYDTTIKIMCYYQYDNGDYYYLDVYAKIYEEWFEGNDKTLEGYVPWKVPFSSDLALADSNTSYNVMKAYLYVCVDGIMYIVQVTDERLMARLDPDVAEARAGGDHVMAQLASIKEALAAQKDLIFGFDLDDLTPPHDLCLSKLP